MPYEGNDSWVEGAIIDIKKCLDSDELPAADDACDYCKYREVVGKKMLAFAGKAKKNGGQKSMGI